MGADPVGDRGLRHSAPTYISRDTRDLRPDGHRGLATFARRPATSQLNRAKALGKGLSRPAGNAGGTVRVWAIHLDRAHARPLSSFGSAEGMRILFLGDVVGRSGRTAVIESLPRLRERYRLGFVVGDSANAAGGAGDLSE